MLEELGVSYAQYEIMEHLADRPNLHAGESGRRLRITRQTAHELIKNLARADLIDLLPPDGGVRPARLTSIGRRRLKHCRDAVAQIHVDLEQVEPHTRLTFLDSLSALDARLAPSVGRAWWLG